MEKWNRRRKGPSLSKEQQRLIKNTLFRMFEDNRVAIVDIENGKLKPYQIRVYVMLKAGFE